MSGQLVDADDVERLIEVFGAPLSQTVLPDSPLMERLSTDRLVRIAYAYGMEKQLERIAVSLNTDIRLARLVENESGRRRMKSDAVGNLLSSFGVKKEDNCFGNFHLVMPLFFDYKFKVKTSPFLTKEVRDEIVTILSTEFGISEDSLLSLEEKFLKETPLAEHQPISKIIDQLSSERNKQSQLFGFEKMNFHLRSFAKELFEGLGWVILAFALIVIGAAIQYWIRHN